MKAPLSVVLVALNRRGNYSLALHYLKLYAQEDAELKKSVRFNIVEFPVDSHTKWMAARILALRPDVVGFSCNVWNIGRTLRVARFIKRIRPGVRVVCGGQEMTHTCIDYMELHPYLDVRVDGEGEGPFRELLRHYLEDTPLDDVRGIQFRSREGLCTTPPAPPLADLDSIPSPYLQGSIAIRPDHNLGMMVETSRGCRFQCAFCFEGSRFARVRYFSMERVEEEIRTMARRGVRNFHILDPILANADRDRLAAFHNIVESHIRPHGPYTLSVEVHAELLAPDTMRYLAPFTVFDVGLQSITPEALRWLKRGVSLKRFQEGVRMLMELNRQTNLYLIMGLPGENFFRHLNSIRFCIDQDVSRLFLNHLCVLNGTTLRREADKTRLKFSQAPPYVAHSNYSFSAMDMQLGHVFGNTVMREHDAQAKVSVFGEAKHPS